MELSNVLIVIVDHQVHRCLRFGALGFFDSKGFLEYIIIL